MSSGHPQSAKNTAQIGRLIIVGLGLIGGSLARALKPANYCETIIGVDANPEAIATGTALGVIDSGFIDVASFLASEHGTSLSPERDVVYLSVPTLAMPSAIAQIKSLLSLGMTITDGASVKGSVRSAYQQEYSQVPANVVLGHPIAGSEKSGVAASFAELFHGKRSILCPLENTGLTHLQKVEHLWQAAGAQVHSMSVETHDAVFAATSHLPHVIAFSLVDTLASSEHSDSVFQNAAGGFKEFTRVASSDPKMWKDICIANKAAILEGFDAFADNMQQLRQAIESGDEAALMAAFTRAKSARDHFLCAQ